MKNRRVSLVTGAASGIGRSTAQALGRAGDVVYVVDLADEGAGVANDIEDAHFIRCDVTSESSLHDAASVVAEQSGRLDVLVNNAGGFPEKRGVEDTSPEDWGATVELNLTAVFFTTKAMLPLLRKSSAGRVINLGSLAGQTAGYRTSPAYVAAKAGVHGLTRALAWEVAEDGITVNALSPSLVLTERIIELRDEAEREATAASVPLGRYQSPEEVAEWVLMLASEEAGYMTGQTVSVNGGRFMA